MEVDVLRISSRLLLLKSLRSEHSQATTNMIHNSRDINEIVEFMEQQHFVFREFAKQVESGDYDF
jgi:hypothetical protein